MQLWKWWWHGKLWVIFIDKISWNECEFIKWEVTDNLRAEILMQIHKERLWCNEHMTQERGARVTIWFSVQHNNNNSSLLLVVHSRQLRQRINTIWSKRNKRNWLRFIDGVEKLVFREPSFAMLASS